MLFKQPYENMRLDGKIWEILQRCEDLKRKSMQTLDLAPVKGELTVLCFFLKIGTYSSGWWLTYPSEK